MVKTRSDSKIDLEQVMDKMSTLASKECIDQLKTLILEQNEKIAEQRALITNQGEQIQSLYKSLDEHESKKNILRDRVAVLSSAVDHLKLCSDNQEQYSRRSCLRINGVKKVENETAAQCLDVVAGICQEMGVDVPSEGIERAHRVGKERKAIIVKFTSFKYRTQLYRKRNKNGPVKIHLDLTKQRLSLLDKAKELITDDCNVEFVFADINCNTVARMKDNSYKFFKNVDEFTNFLF